MSDSLFSLTALRTVLVALAGGLVVIRFSLDWDVMTVVDLLDVLRMALLPLLVAACLSIRTRESGARQVVLARRPSVFGWVLLVLYLLSCLASLGVAADHRDRAHARVAKILARCANPNLPPTRH